MIVQRGGQSIFFCKKPGNVFFPISTDADLVNSPVGMGGPDISFTVCREEAQGFIQSLQIALVTELAIVECQHFQTRIGSGQDVLCWRNRTGGKKGPSCIPADQFCLVANDVKASVVMPHQEMLVYLFQAPYLAGTISYQAKI